MDAERKIIDTSRVTPMVSVRKRRMNFILGMLILLMAAGLIAAFWLSSRQKVMKIKDYSLATVAVSEMVSTTESSGSVVFPKQISIVSPDEGYAGTLLAREGDSVTPADVLAVIDVPDLDDLQDDLTGELETARISLEDLSVDNSFALADLKRSISRLDEDIEDARNDVAEMKELSNLKSSRKADYDSAVDNLDSLLEQKEDLVSSLSKQEKKGALTLQKQQAIIRQLEVSLNRVREDLDNAHIKSPISGEVLSLNEDLSVPGSLIEQNAALFVVADRTEAFFDFEVYEQYSGLLKEGGEMAVTVSSQTVKAVITQVGKVATLSSDGLSAMVTVRAKPLESLDLTPGASAVAVITLGVKEGVLMLPRGAYLTTGSQKYVYKLDGKKAVKTSVSFGEIQGTQVEVLGGLSAGDRIITSGYQNFIDQDSVELE